MENNHRTEITHISEESRQSRGTLQWFLERDNHPPIHQCNHLEVLICGEESFSRIADDIAKATTSIDIICWGFDPGMELKRSGNRWPRGQTYGDLLADAAELKGVNVRLLCWADWLASLPTNNLPGYTMQWTDTHIYRSEGLPRSKAMMQSAARQQLGWTTKNIREAYTTYWYAGACNGQANFSVRMRSANGQAVKKSLDDEGLTGQLDVAERATLEKFATHHQKTILIDFQGDRPVGYVMGLNSVTDYWDTQKHLFNEPLRGRNWEGQSSKDEAGLKPFQDYVCRIQGQALIELHNNFESAWLREEPHAVPRTAGSAATNSATSRQPTQEELARTVAGMTLQRAQVVRTQPEEKEANIKRLYLQASSFARNYIYIENQYFQYTDWAKQLKADRCAFVAAWKAAGKSMADLPDLHVMVLTPTPERVQMVPRTYDTVKTLGNGNSMPNQTKLVDDEVKYQQQTMGLFNDYLKSGSAGMLGMPPPGPLSLSDVSRTAMAQGNDQDIAKELDSIGMRTLMGSLFTYNDDWRSDKSAVGDAALRYREIYIHSKLMIIDDSFFTLGSANLSVRSMAVDSEINIASDDADRARDLRKRVWVQHTGGAEGCAGGDASSSAIARAFKSWKSLSERNAKCMKLGLPLAGFIVPFYDKRTSKIRFA